MNAAKKDADVARQIAELGGMSVGELQARFLQVWGEPTTNRNRTQLRRRIAWKIQEIAYGGLSAKALRRAEELADLRYLRIRTPRGFRMPDEGGTTVQAKFSPAPSAAELLPDTVITREYQGRRLVVMVLDKGFEFEGHRFRTSDWRLINTSGDYDLYDLSSFRYEVEDVSASNPSVVSSLSTDLNVQGTRPGTSYATWAGSNPLLADPNGDGDGDGCANRLEYGAGSDALDPASRPSTSFSFEDLTSLGFGGDDPVFRFDVAVDRDDLALLPSTSTNLLDWSFEPLEFLDVEEAGGSLMRFRFRLTDASAAARFFRLESE